MWSPWRLSIRTVRGDSSGDYLSCLIHSAGLQLGPLMHQKLTLSDYDVVRPSLCHSVHTLIGASRRSVGSTLISVKHETRKSCDDKP